VAVAVVVAATVLGLLWRRQRGRITAVRASGGGAVTLLLFTTPSCVSCGKVRELCATVEGAEYREVDASTDLASARAFDVWRAPTLLVLDGAGSPVWRATGVPARDELIAAVRAV
jgi:hypothetical protein